MALRRSGSEAGAHPSPSTKTNQTTFSKFQGLALESAGVYIDQSYSTLFSNINPGNSVEGVIVFDIPKDQTPVSAELHDSSFSDGVKINLQ